MNSNVEQLAINTLRFLAVDAVEAAKSGHPGAPLGAAPMAYTLWHHFLRHNPKDPKWPNRDRFVLSAGHASALLYALLHMTGYDLPLDEIKRFRQWDSKTPGHPEARLTPGVEMTSGPLGQGFAAGVGMALAEKWLAARYNHPGHKIIDHYTYGLVSDGDLQEGLSYEAASLAGHWRLGKLIYLYDDNGVQIEGPTSTNFTEDVRQRFKALHWHVAGPVDGNDVAAIARAITEAQNTVDRPSLVVVKTTIGYGSPLAGSAETHGAPLGPANVAKTKTNLGWPLEPAFHVPDEAREHLQQAITRGAEWQAKWQTRFNYYQTVFPRLAKTLLAQLTGELPADWETALVPLTKPPEKSLATRTASGRALNALAQRIEFLMGGSADLGPSNQTMIKGEIDLSADAPSGRNIHFGVREHAMAAIAGGLALHGGVAPYTGTFLIFSDYMRPAIRIAALTGIRVVYVFSHDSIGLGEDGPTHQPVEQLTSLRAIPNLTVIRPADAAETAEAWRAALRRTTGPTALVLTRQNVPTLDRAKYAPAEGLHRGAYVLWQSSDKAPDVILLGTGSEVHLALAAGEKLAQEGIAVRVVSMPSWELFDGQPAEYRDAVLPPSVRARVSVEAGSTLAWARYVGLDGASLGLDCFGGSAPYAELYEKFGLTADGLAALARQVLARTKSRT